MRILLIGLAALLPAVAQVLPTAVPTDDHSSSTHTLPAAKGPAGSKPVTCTVGEQYFAIDATAGSNLYFCTSTNVWTQISGSGGGTPGGVSTDMQINSSGVFGAVHPTGGTASYPYWNGTAWSMGNIQVGGSGGLDCSTVPGQCDIVSAIIPFKGAANTFTGTNIFSSLFNQFNAAAIPTATAIPYGNVMAWGDSLTFGVGSTGTPIFPASGGPVTAGSWPLQLQSSTGVNVAVNASSGRTSAQISSQCTIDTSRIGWLNVIWAGTNDPGSSIAYTTTISNINLCIATLTGPYIVMTPLTTPSVAATLAPSGATYLSYFQPLQTQEIITFGDHLVDVWQGLINISCGTLYNGVSYADATACTARTTPPAFVTTGPHLNNLGYGFVSSLIRAWMQSHGGYTVPSVTSFNTMLYQSGALGNVLVGTHFGTGQHQVVTATPALPEFRNGTFICYTPDAANTGPAPDLYIDGSNSGTFPYPIVKTGGAALAPSDIATTAQACVIFNVTGGAGGQWELQNPQTANGSGTSPVKALWRAFGAVDPFTNWAPFASANDTVYVTLPPSVPLTVSHVKIYAGNVAGNLAFAFYDSTTCAKVPGSDSPTQAANTNFYMDYAYGSPFTLPSGAIVGITGSTSGVYLYAAQGVGPYDVLLVNTGENSSTYPVFMGPASMGSSPLVLPSSCGGTRTAFTASARFPFIAVY